MRLLAFDGRTGASGDMLLAALLAAGADRDALDPVEAALDVEYVVSERTRAGIAATAVDVVLADESGEDDDESHSNDHSHTHGHDVDGHSHDDDHSHKHSHDHDHTHEHGHDADGHSHNHSHAEGAGPNRTFPEVIEIVEGMELPETVADDAKAIFRLLGEAEASVHGTNLSETHFHEVGADDAIADIVGAALLLDDLDVDRVVTTPISAGGGTVEMSHGEYPVPTPAVVEIAERADWTLRGGPVDAELLTPTGAAILAHVAEGREQLPPLDVAASGYGAGDLKLDGRPNVLRALVGEPECELRRDDIAVLETNVDDVAPEVLGGLQETLAKAGARDVTIVPTTMKKSRPGHLVKVIAKPEDAERVARRLAEETGTLGVREGGASHRWIADRSFETARIEIDGEEYEIDVKIASDADGAVYDVSAEYDDAAAVAAETGRPIRELLRRAEAAVDAAVDE
ncbi:nickel pincer cofactor biosynthesis protein LarC [Natronoarchaeum rubrum]|uniref:nickel pincer cofactor biosynthesis protein LarC n=1 Tax=Natronoarchaeum rubrum TaxID=755311 RepID=UPI002111D27C|nr:nickel pincer cofactor biosynthesis protein LarC [Natronoarchaeum rubrum]